MAGRTALWGDHVGRQQHAIAPHGARTAALRSERGAAGIETMGIVVVAAILLAVVVAAASPWGSSIASGIDAAICRVTQGECSGSEGEEAVSDSGPAAEPAGSGTEPTPQERLAEIADMDGEELADYLERLPAHEREALLEAARRTQLDNSVSQDERVGAAQLLIAEAAPQVRASADDYGIWEEWATVMSDPGQAQRRQELERLIAEAPDGSLLADLRDGSIHFNAEPTPEQFDRAVARAEEGRFAQEIAGNFAGWLGTDRNFVHFEVDLENQSIRAAELTGGNLDTAEHVAVTIPGTLMGDGMGEYIDGYTRGHGNALYNSLSDIGVDNTAVISCVCYDPPRGLVNAVSGSHAETSDLAAVVDALPSGNSPDLHILGHSYGGVAVGHDVVNHGLEAANLICLGCPGFGGGVTGPGDLPGAATVWGIRHPQDPIQVSVGVHGTQPEAPRFGGESYDYGSGWGWSPGSHSTYYTDAVSVQNLAYIVSGQEDLVTGRR
ncbi:alpha/beta hydrolase family protein [Bogoriella caseilytica]|uniref:Alpha/beta hydrolase family protein n=2 Tax=Bogoriella caseilytica TaxID=56055 RepID=A0A3N2BG79_9MICO|nr:alpha/beta hydrolase family protein [Bogoriella caseilytica]